VASGLVGERQTAQYVAVHLGRDFGAELEVTAGLAAGETVVVHPGDAFREGTQVRPVSSAPQSAAPREELARTGETRSGH
jgi:hypothetical protein